MSRGNIWFISKYIAVPSDSAPGARGFELMREVVSAGYEVTLFAASPNHLTTTPEFPGRFLVETVDGVRICWIRTLDFRGAKSLRRILSWIHFELLLLFLPKRRFGRPDVVVASSLSLLSILTGIVFKRRYRARLIFEVRDIWPLTIQEEGDFSPKNPFVRALGLVERIGYRNADEIVGTMPNLGQHVGEVLGYSRTTHCIPMGIAERTVDALEPLPDGYREDYLVHDRFTIGYAGTIGITNALEPFFQAAAQLAEDPSLQFVLIGDGGLLKDYRDRYAHLPNLTFAPKIPRGAVASALAELDLLYLSVHKSRVWDYGMSLNKLMDYMLAAKPVIASYDGYPSMINEAKCGTFVPAGDAAALTEEIRRYAALSADERSEIGQRGRSWLLETRPYRILAEDYLELMFPPRP